MPKQTRNDAWESRQAVNIFLGRVERHPQDGKLGVRTKDLRWATRQTGIPFRMFYRIARALDLDVQVEPFTVRPYEPMPRNTFYRWVFPKATAFDAEAVRKDLMVKLADTETLIKDTDQR